MFFREPARNRLSGSSGADFRITCFFSLTRTDSIENSVFMGGQGGRKSNTGLPGGQKLANMGLIIELAKMDAFCEMSQVAGVLEESGFFVDDL